MIRCNLLVLLAERNKKISSVSDDTKISRTTLTALAYNKFKGIQTDTLNTLCKYLNVDINELLLFYPLDLVSVKNYDINFDEQTMLMHGQAVLTFNYLKNDYPLYVQYQCEVSSLDAVIDEHHIYELYIKTTNDTDNTETISILKKAPRLILNGLNEDIAKELSKELKLAADAKKNLIYDYIVKWNIDSLNN